LDIHRVRGPLLAKAGTCLQVVEVTCSSQWRKRSVQINDAAEHLEKWAITNHQVIYCFLKRVVECW